MDVENFHLFETLLSQIEQTSRIVKTLGVRYFNEKKDVNLTYNEFFILNSLYNNPNIHQRDLAKLVLMGTANLSRELEKLEKKGLITRKADTKNKRVVKTISVTKIGEEQLNNAISSIKKYIYDIEKMFNDKEYKEFSTYLKRIRTKLTESIDMVFE